MSFQSINKNTFFRFCLIGMMSFVLIACGGGGEGSEADSASSTGNASNSSAVGPETSVPEESTPAPEENTETPSNVGSNEGSNQGGSPTNSEEPVEEDVPVVPVRTSVSLNWGIPLEREDGSDLELYEINGYVIAYGTDANNLDTEVAVIGAGETSVVIDDLVPDTYYFAIATIDSNGLQGAFSNAVQKEVI